MTFICVLGLAGAARAQDYPTRTVRIITGGVGGGNDFAARLIATPLSGALGQPVIVENRGGGVASAEAASKAPPDGYSLLVTGGTLWVGPLLQKMPYDAVRDFVLITIATSQPNILVVHPSLPVNSVSQLVALAKSKPGALNHTYSSIGASDHIAGELFKALAGIKIVGVPYKSDAQEIADLIGGYVQMSFQGGAKVGPHVKSGKLKALAVTSAQPSALQPGLPTVAAAVPRFESVALQAVLTPTRTPEAIVNRLNQEIVRILNRADVKQKFFDTGVETVANSVSEAMATMKSDIARVGKVIKDAGIRAE